MLRFPFRLGDHRRYQTCGELVALQSCSKDSIDASGITAITDADSFGSFAEQSSASNAHVQAERFANGVFSNADAKELFPVRRFMTDALDQFDASRININNLADATKLEPMTESWRSAG